MKSKIFEQIKSIFNMFSKEVFILNHDFKLVWRNTKVSFDVPVDLSIIKELKTLSSSNIDKVVIPTSHGRKIFYIAPLYDLFILFISDPLPEIKNKMNLTTNKPQSDLDNSSTTFVYTSEAMKKTLNLATKSASVDANILITGETGVGKTFMARYIHSSSSRKNGPFVSINCGAIPSTLLEAELFGYEKGTFTGADKTGRVGLLETGIHGTVLLDEIAELSKDLQVKLLYAIDEKKITRVGGRKSIDLDIRLIAATNKDPIKMVNEGDFREDLFYRLNVISFTIPPLRKRMSDILPIVNQLLERYNNEYNVCKTFDPKVIKAFTQYNWPGNIRELQNSIERMVVMSENEVITVNDLPSHILPNIGKISPRPNKNGTLQRETDVLECELIRKAIKENKSIRKAANTLGISHVTLLRKIKKLNLYGANIAMGKDKK